MALLDSRYEGQKAPPAMVEKILTSMADTARLFLWISPYECQDVIHGALDAGGCGTPSRTVFRPEFRDVLSQYKSSHQDKVTNSSSRGNNGTAKSINEVGDDLQ